MFVKKYNPLLLFTIGVSTDVQTCSSPSCVFSRWKHLIISILFLSFFCIPFLIFKEIIELSLFNCAIAIIWASFAWLLIYFLKYSKKFKENNPNQKSSQDTEKITELVKQ